MSVDYSQLLKFSDDLAKLNDTQRENYILTCLNEIAQRVLAKVTKRTPVGRYKKVVQFTTKAKKEVRFKVKSKRVGGTLRRGWTVSKIRKEGNSYIIDIINPVEYAPYVEYGHRTANGGGWVKGLFMLTVSMQEIERMTPQIMERRMRELLKVKDVM